MIKPVFRKASAADIPFIAETYMSNIEALHGFERTEDDWKTLLIAPGVRYFIGSLPEDAAWLRLERVGDTLWLDMLQVHPRFKRRGIGRAAVAFTEEIARDLGIQSVGIHATADNHAALGLYLSCGYRITETGECTTADGVKRIGHTFFKSITEKRKTMKVGILCAMESELAPFMPLFEKKKQSEEAMLTFHEGILGGVDTVLVACGVCKVNAAIATRVLIDKYGVTAVINAGTSGGMDKKLKILDVGISTEVAYHDVSEHILVRYHPHMESPFFKADPTLVELSRIAASKYAFEGRAYWGRLVTGEAFIDTEGRNYINERYAPLTVDMETAAVAHVCHTARVPFLAIRSVTDTEENSGVETAEVNVARASEIAAELTAATVAEMAVMGASK